MATRFALDFRIARDSLGVGDLGLCEVRLQDDARYPWLVLIPRLGGLREVEDLAPADRARLIEEGVQAGAAVRALGEALGLKVEKLNLAALGNVAPQLHLHVVGRRAGDPAWPGPVFGHSPAQPYDPVRRDRALAIARGALGIP